MKEQLLKYCNISGDNVKEFNGVRNYVATGDVINGLIVASQKVTFDNRPSRANQNVKIDELLFAKMKNTKKVIQVNQSNKDFIYSTGFYVIEPKNEIYSRYLYWFLNSNSFNNQKDIFSVGTTMKAINDNGLKKIMIKTIPNYSVQLERVKILDKIGSAIENRKRIITDLEECGMSLYKLIDTSNCDKKRLCEVAELERGKSKHRPRNDSKIMNGKYPLIQTGDIASSGLFLKEYRTTYNEEGLKQSKLWPKGTLCITIAANIAKSSILGFDSCFPDSVVGFNSNVISNVFFHYWLESQQKYLEKVANQAAQKNINLNILNELKIPVVPLNLQKKFDDQIIKIEKQKELIEQDIKDLESLLETKMHEYFD